MSAPTIPARRSSPAPKTPVADQVCMGCIYARVSQRPALHIVVEPTRRLECHYDAPQVGPMPWPPVLTSEGCRRWSPAPKDAP